jgi:phosphoribosyl 1,2-cyclic phosphodiesterase/DNA-binding response OmpR family regulator
VIDVTNVLWGVVAVHGLLSGHGAPDVQVTFWGTRGSISKPGPTTLRYGGNTSCVELRSNSGTLVVLDCGTGALGLGERLLGAAAGSPVDGHLLISHTHWDHIQGIPFFAPLFQPGNTWNIYGPRGLGHSIRETLAGQMEYSYFPVTTEQMGASVEYHDLVEGQFEIGDITVTTQYLNHPALSLGYRLEADGVVVVYASDHEPHHRPLAEGGDLSTSSADAHHAAFLQDADLLIHDAQYLASEYPSRVGWGHSTVEYVVDAATQAGVAKVALYHHDPGRHDDAIDAIVAGARIRSGDSGFTGEVLAAEEGLTIEIEASRSANSRRAANSGQAANSAMSSPALEHIGRSIVTAIHTPEIAAVLRSAAGAEGIEMVEAIDVDAALELIEAGDHAVVVVEDVPPGAAGELASATARQSVAAPLGITVVAVGATSAPVLADGGSITDWLVWPASLGYVRTKLRAWLLRRACLWQNAPLPDDEDRRLESLRRLAVLDTEPESRFDVLTRMASETLDVPIALVSLVDADRQWYKSKVGIDISETPRDLALCAHAILEDDVFQVPNALTDVRFADNPLVAGDPHLRFYAGVPLTLSDGTKAGTLCVIDYRPRLLDDGQVAELRRLAGLVAIELERP